MNELSPRKSQNDEVRDKEILFSKAIRAGKRIYYLDVKRNRKDDLFLAITESKRVSSDTEGPAIFEKHKIFLYKEDFEKFIDGLNEVIDFINIGADKESAPDESNSDERIKQCELNIDLESF